MYAAPSPDQPFAGESLAGERKRWLLVDAEALDACIHACVQCGPCVGKGREEMRGGVGWSVDCIGSGGPHTPRPRPPTRTFSAVEGNAVLYGAASIG